MFIVLLFFWLLSMPDYQTSGIFNTHVLFFRSMLGNIDVLERFRKKSKGRVILKKKEEKAVKRIAKEAALT